MAMGASLLTYYLAEHPSIVSFRWSDAKSLGSTWSFLLSSLLLFHLSSLLLVLLLRLLRRRRPVPLGPLSALHSLVVSLTSASIFLGSLLSSAAEIRDLRWYWLGRTKTTPFQWLLCFPLGTRPSGRVFFWSYAFYLSRFLHLLRTFLLILRRPSHPPPFSRLLSQSSHVLMAFLWLEFSQSFQVLAVASTTLSSAVAYGYRFWVDVGLPAGCFPVLWSCRVAVLGCNVVGHLGVFVLHFLKGGCCGIGAWVFNSVLNGVLLLVIAESRMKRKKKRVGVEAEEANKEL